MSEKKVVELEVKTNIPSLKAQLKEAKAEVLSLSEEFGHTSIEAGLAADRAAELKLQITEGNKLIKAFNPAESLNSATAAMGGVKESIGLVGTSFKLAGGDSEAAAAAMEKVGLAMELSSGISSIHESVTSFKTLGAVVKANTIYQALYNFVMTGSFKAVATDTTAKVADTVATVAQGTATVATTVATTGATAAVKLLRVALISTGIGALVVGIGLLIANFDYLKEKFNSLGAPAKVLLSVFMPLVAIFWAAGAAYDYFMGDSIKANIKAEGSIKKSTAALKAQTAANEKASSALKTKNGHEYNMAEASGASAAALHILAIRHANEEIALERASLATARNTYIKEKNTLAYYRNIGVADDLIEKQAELTKSAYENAVKESKDLQDALETKAQLLRDNEVRIASDKTEAREKSNNKEKKNKETKNKDDKKDAVEQVDITRQQEDEKIRLMEDGRLKEEAAAVLLYKRKKEDEEKLKTEKKLASEDFTTLQIQNAEALEHDLAAIKEKYRLIAEAKEAEDLLKKKEKDAQEKVFLEEITLSEDELKRQKLENQYKSDQEKYKDNTDILTALKTKYEADVDKIDAEALVKKRELEEKKIGMAMSAMSVLNDAIQAGAGKSEKSQRKAFKAQKAFNLASAIVNTYLAVTGALTAGGNPLKLATGMQFVEAGIAAAAGAVQISKIAKTQFDSSSFSKETTGGGGDGGTSPQMSAPQFNVVGQSGVNQLATLGQQQPIQAYVVSGQVTSQQALDRNRLENATLGG